MRDICVPALQGGAHVICEKPFVSTVEEADRVLAAAAAAGRSIAVNHQYREKPIFRAVKERVGAPDTRASRLLPDRAAHESAAMGGDHSWRAAMPNRTLFEGGVHLVDLLLHLYGEVPEAVYARHSSGLDT